MSSLSSEIVLPLSSDVNISDISDTLRDICKCTLFHLNAVQRNLSYWQIKHDGLDSLWNSVSLTDYTPNNHVSLPGKWTVVAIRVLLKLRYDLYVFLSQVYTELELGRNAHDFITHLDAHFSTLSESVTSIDLGSLAFESLAELDFFAILSDGVVLSEISENLAKIDMFFSTLLKAIRNVFFVRPEVMQDDQVREAASELQSMVAKFVNVESTANTPEKEIVELVERSVTSLYDHPIRSFRNGDRSLSGRHDQRSASD